MPKDKLTERGLLQIRSVDPAIIRKLKIYAVSNDLTLAEALKRIVGLARI